MPNYSLLFARTLQDADDSAIIDWGWQAVGELRNEYRRPDTGERARFVTDRHEATLGLRWNTRVYFGRNWEKRVDAERLVDMVETGFFVFVDPTMPPPRAPRKRREELLMSELKTLLGGR